MMLSVCAFVAPSALNALAAPTIPRAALVAPRHRPPHACAIDVDARPNDGIDARGAELEAGLWKSVEAEAPDGAVAACWGAKVSVNYRASFENGTFFDVAHWGRSSPLEAQLTPASGLIDGLQKGIQSMRKGERARLTCEPRWAYGELGTPKRIPPNATLIYDVELVDVDRDGFDERDDDTFDLDAYRKTLEGGEVSSGRADGYAWREGGEEVSVWVPLADDQGKRDVAVDFGLKEVAIAVGGAAVVAGRLRGKVRIDDCYWVIDDDYEGGRALQVVLAKASTFTKWEGLFVE